MKIIKEGSVRVDLLGGTIDLYPINLILPNVVTLNMATGLKAKAEISSIPKNEIIFYSDDYQTTKSFSLHEIQNIESSDTNFEYFEFVARIIAFFKPEVGLQVKLSSGAPTGSGLGGSSAMGAVLFSACCDFFNIDLGKQEIVSIVQNIESRILNAGLCRISRLLPKPIWRGIGVNPRL